MNTQEETVVGLPDGTKYSQPTGIFIDNNFCSSEDGSTLESINPYTQQEICSFARGKKADIDNAIASSKRAWQSWKKTTPQDRGKLLARLADLIERDADLLAKIESIDAGKPVKIAKVADVLASAACLRYYSGWADKVKGETIDTDIDTLNLTIREPLGICGLIIPWNFPILMCGWKLGPALAAGNVVVLKPAELTPLSALYLGKLVVEAGFPPGAVNIVPGLGHEAGAALSAHPDVAKISFTGSTAVGKSILRASAETNLKKVTLELGGKSPSIVLDGADLDEVVEWVNGGIFYNMGQNCCASSRVFVQESVYESFIEKFVIRAKQNQLGDPFDDKTFLGPQISHGQHAKIMGMIHNAKLQGAVLATGGTSPKGWFIEPTIFRDVTSKMDITKEEVFGPVVTVASFKTEEEALSLAHDTCYGLAAAVFTTDMKRGIRMAKNLEAGTVWVNCYNRISHALAFGGYKQSGNGKDLGEEAIYGFTQLKTHPIFDSKEWKDIPITLTIGLSTTPIPILSGKEATETRACLKWEARLEVKAKDMPRLMREGFHWTTANCHRESTYVNNEIEAGPREEGWKCARYYFLSDLGKDPYWTAMLVVLARDIQTLAQFRIDTLRPDMVYTVIGSNAKSQWIYRFDTLDPSQNFNAIYDDMPLEGWWPWLKDKGKQLLS
ncbi:aldehyde dehydrogenase (NAD+) [Colletotrichum karsti]|uniref:aldehyde dehydrogenase (NAD(+)) n=1 Tax=Colletotrichum karsti TaxID=1095194 RepID=A0A9P6I590_9PEZI|nr:aldehyde dehydrogenase (NAD+) [Colletotrichum karsti]KAF9872230.1 aldehyde dehydrogenase (NAD+) [Colletotrichum karsti]